MWHYKGDLNNRKDNQSNAENLWELLVPSEVGPPVVDIQVNFMYNLLFTLKRAYGGSTIFHLPLDWVHFKFQHCNNREIY